MRLTQRRLFLYKYVNSMLVMFALLLCPAVVHSGMAVETNDLLQFDYQQTGANEEEAVRLAGIRAVEATVGRLLFSDYALQARDVLGPYIQKNWNKFVASSYVLERRFERDGFGGKIRVQTFPEVLHRDLREKKFLYLPRANPYYYVFLSHTIDGQPATANLARRAAIDAILIGGDKAYESGVQAPPDGTYLLSHPAVMSAGLEAATRIGAELVVTGYANTQLVDQREVYYSIVYTYETALHLDLIKVDDGTVLASVDVTQRASDSDPAVARDESARIAGEAGTQDLLAKKRTAWRKTVLDDAKFSMMFSNLTPDEVESVSRHLQRALSHGSRVRLKSYFGNVAVFSVDTPRAFAAIERAIIDFKSFDLRIADRQGNRITVDVKH